MRILAIMFGSFFLVIGALALSPFEPLIPVVAPVLLIFYSVLGVLSIDERHFSGN